MTKSKNFITVVAVGCAVVMALSGTFAWILQKDETTLNKMSHSINDYDVEIVEDFEAWVNKDVKVKSKGIGEVIVRMRYEEFLSIDGKDSDVAEQSGIYKASALTTVDHPSGNDFRKDASVLTPNIVDLYFGEKFITMADWNAKISGLSGMNLNAVYQEGWWVIDTDGWCYYTKALKADETSNLSLSNALLNVSNKELKDSYGAPVNLDYHINVRVQAISADLSDYGATNNPAQWTCETTGRVIDDDPDVANEILNDTPITAGSNADKLIRSMYVQLDGYAYSLDSANHTAKIMGFASSVSDITTDLPGYDQESNTIVMPTTINYCGAEYTVTTLSARYTTGKTFYTGQKLVLPQKLVSIEAGLQDVNITGTLTIPASVNYIVSNFISRSNFTELVFDGAKLSNNFAVVEGEADTLRLPDSLANTYHLGNFILELPARVLHAGSFVSNSVLSGTPLKELIYPQGMNTTLSNAYITTRTPYVVPAE